MNLGDNSELDLEMDSEQMKMMDTIRRTIWHLFLEQKSKTISLEDEFRVESLPRYSESILNVGMFLFV